MMGLLSSLALVVIVTRVAAITLPAEIEDAVVIPLATPIVELVPATPAPTLRLTPLPTVSPEPPTPLPLPETGMPTPQVPIPLPTPDLCVPLIDLCL